MSERFSIEKLSPFRTCARITDREESITVYVEFHTDDPDHNQRQAERVVVSLNDLFNE